MYQCALFLKQLCVHHFWLGCNCSIGINSCAHALGPQNLHINMCWLRNHLIMHHGWNYLIMEHSWNLTTIFIPTLMHGPEQ